MDDEASYEEEMEDTVEEQGAEGASPDSKANSNSEDDDDEDDDDDGDAASLPSSSSKIGRDDSIDIDEAKEEEEEEEDIDESDDEDEGSVKSSATTENTPSKKRSSSSSKRRRGSKSAGGRRHRQSSMKRVPSVAGLTIPFRTIKKAMKLDPDTPIVQNEAAIMTTIAVELFVKKLATASLEMAKNRGRQNVRYEDIAEARSKNKAMAFLEPLLP